MAGNSAEPGRTVVSKAALILLTLTVGGGHTLSSVASQTRLPVSTVQRLIRELVKTPLVERKADGEYWPGPALRILTNAAVEPTMNSYGPGARVHSVSRTRSIATTCCLLAEYALHRSHQGTRRLRRGCKAERSSNRTPDGTTLERRGLIFAAA